MITKEIIGDITETECKYIAHGVNCQNVMGSGVALALFTKFPDIKRQYHQFCDRNEDLLGEVDDVHTQKKIIYNCFTQFDFGNGYKNGKRYVNYGALAKCLESIVEDLKDVDGAVLALPEIGCGLAGGDWKFVKQLINDITDDKLEVWVYRLK